MLGAYSGMILTFRMSYIEQEWDCDMVWIVSILESRSVCRCPEQYFYFHLVIQLFAKILHNGSESGSVTLANQIHFSSRVQLQLVTPTCVWLANVILPLPLCKIFANNCSMYQMLHSRGSGKRFSVVAISRTTVKLEWVRYRSLATVTSWSSVFHC